MFLEFIAYFNSEAERIHKKYYFNFSRQFDFYKMFAAIKLQLTKMEKMDFTSHEIWVQKGK